MNDEVRTRLQELIARYGTALADDPRRVEAMLRDVAPHDTQEIFVLVSALRARLVPEVRQWNPALPQGALVSRLTHRLQRELGLTGEAARWSSETWLLALGVPVPPSGSPTGTGADPRANQAAPAQLEPLGPGVTQRDAAITAPPTPAAPGRRKAPPGAAASAGASRRRRASRSLIGVIAALVGALAIAAVTAVALASGGRSPPGSQTALQQPRAARCPADTARCRLGDRVLLRHSSGPDVSQLQRLLRRLGFFGASITGRYGLRTAQAVQAFQACRGLTPTGIADAATIRAVRQVSPAAVAACFQTPITPTAAPPVPSPSATVSPSATATVSPSDIPPVSPSDIPPVSPSDIPPVSPSATAISSPLAASPSPG